MMLKLVYDVETDWNQVLAPGGWERIVVFQSDL